MNETAPRRPSNRRLTARLACQLTVRYRTRKDWHPATAMDLSRNGSRLRVGEDLDRGSSVTVQFEHAGGNGKSPVSVEVGGSVIWSRLEGLSYQVGIQFSEPPDGLDDVISALGPGPTRD
jgi:hypothetical protein